MLGICGRFPKSFFFAFFRLPDQNIQLRLQTLKQFAKLLVALESLPELILKVGDEPAEAGNFDLAIQVFFLPVDVVFHGAPYVVSLVILHYMIWLPQGNEINVPPQPVPDKTESVLKVQWFI